MPLAYWTRDFRSPLDERPHAESQGTRAQVRTWTMVRVTVRQMADVCGARLACGEGDALVRGVAVDSRKVPEGGAFVALPGANVDGNDYAARALEAGAAAVVMTREPDEALLARAAELSRAVLVAADGERFLASLAGWWRTRLDVTCVGVTGSSGKTTTRNMVAAVLASAYRTHCNEANYNNLLGCSLTLLACPEDAQMLVMEMGMDHPGEIAALCEVARPDMGVITNVGVAHIGILGSRENIARAKSELVCALPATDAAAPVPSRVFLWGEDDYTPWIRANAADPHGVRVVTYGDAAADDARATNVTLADDGCPSADLTLPSGRELHVDLAISGAHNVRNALAAASVGDALGVPAEKIAAALDACAPIRMHQDVIEVPAGYTVIDDSYNANPDSMRVALDVLCSLPASRHVACLGDMGELGEREGWLHAIVGAYVAAKGVDELVCVGPISAEMAEAARLMGMPPARVREVACAADAVPVMREMLAPGDACLVMASRSTGLDVVVSGVVA